MNWEQMTRAEQNNQVERARYAAAAAHQSHLPFEFEGVVYGPFVWKIPAYLRPYIHRCCICGIDTWLTTILVHGDNPPLAMCSRVSANGGCEDEFEKLYGAYAADEPMTFDELLKTL